MISSYARELSVAKAAALFDEMLKLGHRPDKIAYTAMIDVYVGWRQRRT